MKKKKKDFMVLRRRLSRNLMSLFQIKKNQSQSSNQMSLLNQNLKSLKKDLMRSPKSQKLLLRQSLSLIKM